MSEIDRVSYLIMFLYFSNPRNEKSQVYFKLFNETIPIVKHSKFLGITFDSYLNFNQHLLELSKKCYERLSIIKILSSEEWG